MVRKADNFLMQTFSPIQTMKNTKQSSKSTQKTNKYQMSSTISPQYKNRRSQSSLRASKYFTHLISREIAQPVALSTALLPAFKKTKKFVASSSQGRTTQRNFEFDGSPVKDQTIDAIDASQDIFVDGSSLSSDLARKTIRL